LLAQSSSNFKICSQIKYVKLAESPASNRPIGNRSSSLSKKPIDQVDVRKKKVVSPKREKISIYTKYKIRRGRKKREDTHVLTLQLMQLLFSHDIIYPSDHNK
jgi:hypothetical protein